MNQSPLLLRTTAILALCCAPQSLSAQPLVPRGPSAELFSEPNFQGQKLVLTGPARNLDRTGFNDRARSVRVTGTWIFCEDSEFDDRCVTLDRDEPNLAAIGLDSRISSAQPKRPDLPPPPPPPPRALPDGPGQAGYGRDGGLITLYSGRNFTGRSRDLRGRTPNVGLTAQSVTATGPWTLCDQEAFRGRCQTISGEVADLVRAGLSSYIGSASPGESRSDWDRPGAPPSSRFDDEEGSSQGTSASFFPRPTLYGRVVPACESGRSGDCARLSADRFCQQVGYARSAYYFVRSGRRSQTLEDVLCLR